MSTILRIDGAGEQQDFAAHDLPISIGVSEDDSLLFGDIAEPNIVAWLGENSGKIFMQPVDGPSPVQLNGAMLKESAWLGDGDTIRIGRTSIKVASDQGVLELSPGNEDDLSGAPEVTPIGPIGPIRRRKARGLKVLFLVFGMLLMAVVFVVVAAPVRVTISPGPDSVSLSGVVPAVPFAGRYLVLPGSYSVVAEKPGYRKLERQITVAFGSTPEFNYKLMELPGYLNVISQPVASANVIINGKPIGRTPLKTLEIEAGQYELRVVADRYLPFTETINISGKGDNQTKEVTLIPAWGALHIASEPTGAEVTLNGTKVGLTPLKVQPKSGNYRIELRKTGWKTLTHDLRIKANETVKLPLFKLVKVTGSQKPATPPAAPTVSSEGVLQVTTSPAGANISVNGEARGRSPISLTLSSVREHDVTVDKAGFEKVSRKVSLDSGSKKSLHIDLAARYGIVFLNTRPAGATLTVDGKSLGSASQRLQLTTEPHKLEITKPGYVPHSEMVTPSLGVSKRLEVKLEKVGGSPAKATANESKTAGGQILRLIRLNQPTRFKVGASRREAGRRSNETQYSVELTRSLYISEKEVTNREYQRFNAQHDSGSENGVTLNGPDQPVVSVSWDDTARYLNWLSKADGLPAAYREMGGKMVAVQPPTTGYRLPTEAEWVFAARYEGGQRPTDKPLKYPWEGGMPPPANSGNYADATASGKLPIIVKGYSDGYAAAAPAGKFPPNKAGIFDLGGNVAEWIHDYYDVYTGGGDGVLRDPMGPKTGDLHVVRGASWRHGGITELRLSYRDYSQKPRSDLGFRIARYVAETQN